MNAAVATANGRSGAHPLDTACGQLNKDYADRSCDLECPRVPRKQISGRTHAEFWFFKARKKQFILSYPDITFDKNYGLEGKKKRCRNEILEGILEENWDYRQS